MHFVLLLKHIESLFAFLSEGQNYLLTVFGNSAREESEVLVLSFLRYLKVTTPRTEVGESNIFGKKSLV